MPKSMGVYPYQPPKPHAIQRNPRKQKTPPTTPPTTRRKQHPLLPLRPTNRLHRTTTHPKRMRPRPHPPHKHTPTPRKRPPQHQTNTHQLQPRTPQPTTPPNPRATQSNLVTKVGGSKSPARLTRTFEPGGPVLSPHSFLGVSRAQDLVSGRSFNHDCWAA